MKRNKKDVKTRVVHVDKYGNNIDEDDYKYQNIEYTKPKKSPKKQKVVYEDSNSYHSNKKKKGKKEPRIVKATVVEVDEQGNEISSPKNIKLSNHERQKL